jgi:hypothetical protein
VLRRIWWGLGLPLRPRLAVAAASIVEILTAAELGLSGWAMAPGIALFILCSPGPAEIVWRQQHGWNAQP